MLRKGGVLIRSTPSLQNDQPTLPLDVIEYIAKILIDDNKHRTAAALNACCKEYHACSLAILWKTVYIRARGDLAALGKSQLWKRVTESAARMHIQWVDSLGADVRILCRMSDVTLPMNSFIVFSDHLAGETVSDLFDETNLDKIESKMNRYLPKVKALVYTEYLRDAPNIEGHHKVDIHLRRLYKTCSKDDLYLWSIINRQGKRLQVFINTPPRLKSSPNDGIIPFAPAKPAYVKRIFVCHGNSENVHSNDGRDSRPVAAAFGTCLALASYSRGYWGTDDHRRGIQRGILSPSGSSTVYVDLESGDVGVKSCMPVVSFR
jgi:hypothetical protein